MADETSVVAQIFDCLEVSIFLKKLLFSTVLGFLIGSGSHAKAALSHTREPQFQRTSLMLRCPVNLVCQAPLPI